MIPPSSPSFAVGPTEPASETGGRNLVLVLEDNDNIALLLTAIMARVGLKVVWTQNGSEALDEFARHRDQIALVFADCRLPDMDGRDVCRQLRRELPGLPVILTSGNVQNRTATSLPEGPHVLFIPKPYAPGEIVARVRGLLAEAAA